MCVLFPCLLYLESIIFNMNKSLVYCIPSVHVCSTAPQCKVIPPSDGVELVSPQGQAFVTRGSVVRYVCRNGYDLTEGQLVLACGHDGHFIGQLPVCTGERNAKESAC